MRATPFIETIANHIILLVNVMVQIKIDTMMFAFLRAVDDAGGPGDRVRVTLTYRHNLITPFLSTWWPTLRLTAMREGIVEKFRTSRVTGLTGGMAFLPGTDELWVTAALPGMPDALYRLGAGTSAGCDRVLQLAVELPDQSAPLGLAFYTVDRFPPSYRDGLFVALHGSWESRRPLGFKIVYLSLLDGQPTPAQDWATGWLIDPPGRSWGRPVDLITGSDGSLYLTDASRGFVYRIYYLGDD